MLNDATSLYVYIFHRRHSCPKQHTLYLNQRPNKTQIPPPSVRFETVSCYNLRENAVPTSFPIHSARAVKGVFSFFFFLTAFKIMES